MFAAMLDEKKIPVKFLRKLNFLLLPAHPFSTALQGACDVSQASHVPPLPERDAAVTLYIVFIRFGSA
jgi:hypothetical protein